jgi:hypothetical protein
MAYNVIIHTPHQDEWNWSSPVIARVGRVYIQVNIVGWVLDVIRLTSFEQPPVDIYTIEVADVQAFLERQYQVFNFYLLNKSIILPDPPKRSEQETEENDSISHHDENDTTTTDNNEHVENSNEEDEQAQELVHQMLTTVQQLVSSPPNSWKGALHQQRHTLTTKLRELQSKPNKVTAVQQGVRVMRQVGQAVAKKTQDLTAVSAPLRKQDDDTLVPMVRVGRILISDLRIFSREETCCTQTKTTVLLGEWKTPIWIRHVVVRASELTPAMSALDENDLAAIYQPIDKVMDVVWKRLLAESAKSQGDQLIHTAMSQVLGIVSSTSVNKQS